MNPKTKRAKAIRSAGGLALLGLFIAAGCTQEVGGDGFQPKPTPNGGSAGTAGALAAGGMMTNGGAPEGGTPELIGGKGGTSTGGHAGTGGSVTMPEGGASGTGGETSGSVCGNNIVEPGEECDDGNTKSGDGCSADCKKNCEVCEQTFCKAVLSGDAGEFNYTGEPGAVHDAVSNCFEMPGLATAGPAANVARKELCQAAVDCAKTQQCAELEPPNLPPPLLSTAARMDFMHCFCTRDTTLAGNYTADCSTAINYQPTHDPNYTGKCKREFQEAAESDTEAGVFGTLPNLAKPLGAADLLLRYCDVVLCAEECFPAATVGVVAQISADILGEPNDVGESPLGDLIADSQRLATATDFAFVNQSAYRPDLGSAGLIYDAAPGRAADADGRVLESEVRQVLFAMDPHGLPNSDSGKQLVTFQLTGEQIYQVLDNRSPPVEISGLTYTLTTNNQMVDVRKDGVPIDKASTYTVTTADTLYPQIRDGAKLGGTAQATATGKRPLEAFIAYLKAHTQPIAPPTLDRFSRVPATCDNGFLDGDEIGVDVCAPAHPTCSTTTHQCVPIACDNGVKDGDETDVDVCGVAKPTCNPATHLCE